MQEFHDVRSDENLIAQIKGGAPGDARAFEAIFGLYWKSVYTFALRFVRTHDVAEDITQDVFARLWDRRHKLAVRATLKAYLLADARGRALDAIKHGRVREQLAESVSSGIENIPALGGIEADNDLSDEIAQLHKAINQLPERAREVAILRWYDRLSHIEIAGMLGISLRTVNNHLTIAMRVLRERLGT